MRLTSLYAENFKCYKNPININLKKFNIIIGKNSAGKSAFLSLIPFVIFNTSKDANDEINLNPYDMDLGSDYADIVHGHNQMTPLTVGATFETKTKKISFRTKIMYFIEVDKILATEFTLKVNNEIIYKASLSLDRPLNKNIAFYQDEVSHSVSPVKFKGLIPKKTHSPESNILISMIRKYNFNLSYLGPFRQIVKRTYTKRKASDFNIGYKGENAPFLLQSHCNEKKLFDDIQNWMKSNLGGKYYVIKDLDKAFSIHCNDDYKSVNLIDEGMGLTQVFPSIINRKLRDFAYINGIEIIEQPELHMHPAAVGAISDLYFEATSNTENTIFIETHSKELLLRARRRIAEGKYKSNDMNIIFIDTGNATTPVKEIKVNDKGMVSYWPQGIFEEAVQEVIALSEAGIK